MSDKRVGFRAAADSHITIFIIHQSHLQIALFFSLCQTENPNIFCFTATQGGEEWKIVAFVESEFVERIAATGREQSGFPLINRLAVSDSVWCLI